MKPDNGDHARIAFAIVFPLVLNSIYLYYSRWPVRWFTTQTDLVVLAISVLLGLLFVINLSYDLKWKIIIGALYVVAAAFALGIYSLTFVCFVFGDCL